MAKPLVVQVFGPTNEGAYDLWIHSTGSYISTRPRAADLNDANEAMLAAVRACVEAGLDWDLRGQEEQDLLLSRLRSAGRDLLVAFSEGGRLEDVRALLQQAQVVSAKTGQHLPWEFVYLGEEGGPVALDQFLGASAVIGRPYEGGPLSRPVNGAGLLRLSPWDGAPASEEPFGILEDGRLTSAQTGAERGIFDQQNIPITVLTPLKRGPSGFERLHEFLGASSILTHFNAHAANDLEDATGRPTSALYVSDEFAMDLTCIRGLPLCERSIVFLNCCEGISLRFGKARTLAQAFAERRVEAVVATTERIGDAYATQWANEFYLALNAGQTVGEAIMTARQSMLARDCNPMAFLYGYLGNHEAVLPRETIAA